MKRLSRYILVLSISALLVLPKNVAQGCGFFIWPGEYRFWLLQPDLTNQRDLTPYFFSTREFYPDDQPESEPPHYRQNVQEWRALVRGKASEQDIHEILYETSPGKFLAHLNQLSQTNSFVRILKQPRNRELLNYLKLSKKIEAFTDNPDPWHEREYPNPQLDSLLSEAEQSYAKAAHPNVRFRLAYQLVRLYGYDNQDRMAGIFQDKITATNIDSWIKDAVLYDRALKAPTYTEKYYRMSKVFDQTNFNRQYCLWGFRQNDLRPILPLAANEHERTVLYAMKAFRDPGRTLHNIKFIYSREPTYKEIPFLLLREINKAEDWLLTNKITGFDPALYAWFFTQEEQDLVKNYKRDVQYTGELYDFVKQMLAEKKHKDQALLQVCAAHLAFIQEKKTACRQHLEAAAKLPNLPANIKTQLQVNDLLLRLEADPSFCQTTENKLMQLLLAPKSRLGVHSTEIMKDQLILYTGKTLIRNGHRAKGLLMLGKTRRALGELSIGAYKSIYELMWEKATAADYDEMLHLLRKEQQSSFERFITKGALHAHRDYYGRTHDELYKKWDVNKLLDLKASWYIRQDSLDEALAVLKQIPGSWWNRDPYIIYVTGDPFYVNIYTGHSQPPQEENFTKPAVIAGMLSLEREARHDKKNAALYYYKLANAYYNLTYHGKLWIMTKPWSSTTDVSTWYNTELTVSRFNDNYYGCDRAKKYYLKALQQTTDKKLASLCALMARQCEQHYQDYRAISVFKKEAKKVPDVYPDLLKKKGMDDDYYNELIEECATYNSFITQLNKLH